jgi:hypothetical protein
VLIQGCGYIIAIRFAFSRLSQIEKSSVPTWYLHAFETEISGPFGYAVQTVEWRVIAGELRQENGRTLDRFHSNSPQKMRTGNSSAPVSPK